ncbi:hypothetical protein [Flavobacterium sp.]|uniref:hypothetical protein n=1 Tax=Flavobacterium sp. TaxID=239 RepID=UPI00286B088F|nr:hypothetical protein [Flavobacterium sp.]
MRKIIFVSIIVFFIPLVSFSQMQNLNVNVEGKIFHNPKSETNRILGTPYTQSKFAYAEIENIDQKHFMRYNAYSDNFEFITFKNDTLEMIKTDNINNITFTNPHKKYSYVNYISSTKGRMKGFLVELYANGSFALYKKEAITYYAGKKARNSQESDLPARYSKVSYSYFLKTKAESIIPFPDSKKQLIKLYPDKKEAIEAFVKENKIDFDADEDRIKIIAFLAG